MKETIIFAFLLLYRLKINLFNMIIDRESQLFNLEIEINNQKKFRFSLPRIEKWLKNNYLNFYAVTINKCLQDTHCVIQCIELWSCGHCRL